ncbi:hypothetical protein NDU88_003131 [Pleurodeles waltl]|uniref:Uncharacterized protein n=1 Tax=Pleurodeles waltl TaxID=8319 RepID=A0AAV7WN64_PLEWA|nr:hypothetical protein NDU88_003131 [Pleurodeles waltl]
MRPVSAVGLGRGEGRCPICVPRSHRAPFYGLASSLPLQRGREPGIGLLSDCRRAVPCPLDHSTGAGRCCPSTVTLEVVLIRPSHGTGKAFLALPVVFVGMSLAVLWLAT